MVNNDCEKIFSRKRETVHCVLEPDPAKLKCLHHFYTDNYNSNDKNCHYLLLIIRFFTCAHLDYQHKVMDLQL